MSDQQAQELPVGEELRTLAVLAAHQQHSLMFFDRLVENGYVKRWPSGYEITEKGRAALAARLPERPDEAFLPQATEAAFAEVENARIAEDGAPVGKNPHDKRTRLPEQPGVRAGARVLYEELRATPWPTEIPTWPYWERVVRAVLAAALPEQPD